MGLFSSKKKTTVATSVVRIMDDANIPDSPKTGLLKAILQDYDIAPSILSEFHSSVGSRIDRMYKYASTKYPLGIPTKSFSNRGMGRDLIEEIIAAEEGQQIEIEYSVLGAPNIMHFAWMQIIKNFGYDTSTNILHGISTTHTEYMNGMSIVIPQNQISQYESASLEQFGYPSTGGYKPWASLNTYIGSEVQVEYTSTSATGGEHVRVTYGHLERGSFGGSRIVLLDFSLIMPEVNDDGDYFHVCYFLNGKRKYWAYLKGSGKYPELDSLTGGSPIGSFYPRLYFRYEKQAVTEALHGSIYKESVKMADMVGIDFDNLRDTIHENPDIKDVEQAILSFAVPANTSDPVEQKYLYSFFDEMFFAVGTGDDRPVPNRVGVFARRFNLAAKNVVTIQDAWFSMSLSNAGMAKHRVAGVIGPVGSYSSGFAKDSVQVTRMDADSGSTYTEWVPYDYHYYRKQVSDSFYDEVQVMNLKMTYKIYGNYETTGDDTGDILLVPIDRKIIEKWSIPEKEILVSRGMHLIFNSRVVTKVKWYQTGIFKAFVIIVMVIITIWTGGSGAAGLSAALAAGGTVALTAIWTMIIIPILQNLLISAILKFFVEKIGGEFALAVAIIAVAYGAYNSYGDLASTWGDTLLSVGNGLIKAIGDNYMDLLKDVYSELEAFSEYSSDLWDQLEETSKALLGEQNNHLSPFILFGETPDDYYSRTVHSGNIGVSSFTAVSSYADMALKLPTINDTIESPFVEET